MASRQVDAVAMHATRAEMMIVTSKMITTYHDLGIFVCEICQPLKTLVDIMTGSIEEGEASWTVAAEEGKTVIVC